MSVTDLPQHRFQDLVAGCGAVDLATLDAHAALRTRVDRKYVLPLAAVTGALRALDGTFHALEIDGSRAFAYRSLYFDTPDHTCFRAAATGRRRRCKVRIREYVASGDRVLEVKTRGGRGETVKARLPYDDEPDGPLTATGASFVDEHAGAIGLGERLRPAAWTRYVRSTLVDLHDGTRATVDVDLATAAHGGPWAVPTGAVIVETKAVGTATPLDRALWVAGHRPDRISKFAVAMIAAHPDLPTNRWHRTLQRLG